jgi:hypothetical protein
MRAETDIRRLLANMQPQLHEGEFVFTTVSPGSFGQLGIQPIGWFREAEGISLSLDRRAAEGAGLRYDFVFRMITLSVHSSLHAVGFLAAVADKLASGGISVNAVAAYHHDHLFVPVDRAGLAMDLLHELSSGAT